jgi:hypothetical protein
MLGTELVYRITLHGGGLTGRPNRRVTRQRSRNSKGEPQLDIPHMRRIYWLLSELTKGSRPSKGKLLTHQHGSPEGLAAVQQRNQRKNFHL